MVTVEQYTRFRRDGYLIVRGLIERDEIDALLDHMAALPDVVRIHMLHRRFEIHERFMLHPRLVGVSPGSSAPTCSRCRRCASSSRPARPARATTRTPSTSSPSRTR